MSDDLYEEVPEYRDEGTPDAQPKAKKLRGPARHWIKEKEFENRASALEFIAKEGCWSVSHNHDTFDGRKVFYRCKRAKKGDAPCIASIHLLYHAEKESITLYRTEQGHDHVETLSPRGLDPKIREAIEQLYDDGVQKPISILCALRSKGLPEPGIIALRNFLQSLKKKRQGAASIMLRELEEWCKQHSTLFPEEPNKAFVIRRFTGQNGDGKAVFRVFMSTPRLLQFALRSDVLHADATYKIMWQGCPVLVVGTSDRDGQFFPIGVGVCSGETSDDFAFIFQSIVEGVSQICDGVYRPNLLIADASDAITNAFALVFGDNFKRITCSAHMMRAIDRKLEKIKDCQKRQQLRADIIQLQLCPSEEVFTAVSGLFFDKWSEDTAADVHDLLDYFKREWVDRHPNWYEGYADNAPSTNNGLQALNNTIQSEQVLRQRLPLPRFMSLLEESLLVQWSTECDPSTWDYKKFANVPTKTTSVWTKAYEWATSPRNVLSRNVGDGFTEYYVAAGDAVLTPALVTAYRSAFLHADWQSFDQYVTTRNSLWVVLMNGAQYEDAACNCPAFLKEFICEHTLGIAIRRKYCEPPESVKSIQRGEKRKRGRPPSSATAGLIG